ncbi:response regulator transcription factor [Phormidium tenue FACHB-886]|nr:response regulator transcription factor [Phormidium tenue FACHB-886]
MIRLLLVEDQEIIRRGLKTLLDTKPDLKVIAEAENGQRAIQVLEALQATEQSPDVVLMDIRMPVMDGVMATQQIRQQFPEAKILILTTFDDTQYVAEALRHGAKGYLLKDTPSEELAEAIHSIHRGYTQFGPGILEKMIAHVPPPELKAPEPPRELQDLTAREREVLRLIATGASNREIAQTLFLTEGTVRNHISRILMRLNLRDRTQAAILANTFLPLLEDTTAD